MKRRSNFRRKIVGPMVSQEAVSDFFNKKRGSYLWLKKVPRKTLLEGLDFEFPGVERYIHQLACFNIGIVEPHFLFLLEMGAGKSLLIMDLVRYLQQHNKLGRVLVLVPKEVNVQSWIDEIKENAPMLTATALMGNKADRQALLKKQTDLYLLTYPGLAVYMTALVKEKGKRKRKRQIVPKIAKAFTEMFDMCVFDESHHIGKVDALIYRECRWFTKHCRFRYGLTGTPFGRDPTKLWTQFSVVDDGETLGKTLGIFRAAFFDATEHYFAGIKYEFDESMEKDLHRMLQHRSIFYEDTEFDDLPKVKHIRKNVHFSVTAEEQYRNVVRQIRESHGSAEELQSAFVRMRMVTSGYLSVKSEVEDERLVVFFEENPKLEALEGLLQDVPLGSKALVYHDYQVTGQMISRMLTKNGMPHSTLSGLTKDPSKQLKRFLQDDAVRFMVANNQSGATGINPQKVCNYIFYYEAPPSPILRRQGIKRVNRGGQTKKHVYIYDLCMPDTVDTRILDFLEEGKDLFQVVCSGKKRAKELLL